MWRHTLVHDGISPEALTPIGWEVKGQVDPVSVFQFQQNLGKVQCRSPVQVELSNIPAASISQWEHGIPDRWFQPSPGR